MPFHEPRLLRYTNESFPASEQPWSCQSRDRSLVFGFTSIAFCSTFPSYGSINLWQVSMKVPPFASRVTPNGEQRPWKFGANPPWLMSPSPPIPNSQFPIKSWFLELPTIASNLPSIKSIGLAFSSIPLYLLSMKLWFPRPPWLPSKLERWENCTSGNERWRSVGLCEEGPGFWLIEWSFDFLDATFLFFRHPPPTGMFLRVPPLVQYLLQVLQKYLGWERL